MDKKKPFWETSYQRPGKLDTFGGGKPGASVIKAAGLLSHGGSALDLGCGEGRNAIYLAQIGFNAYASDISESGIAKLKSTALKMGLSIDAVVRDMRQYDFPRMFDLIVCQGCLHLIHRHEWPLVIKNMQENTVPGGIHATGVFTDTVPEPEDQRGLMVGLFKEGELKEYYDGWEIIEYSVYRFTHAHPDGPTHEHAGNDIIARKPL